MAATPMTTPETIREHFATKKWIYVLRRMLVIGGIVMLASLLTAVVSVRPSAAAGECQFMRGFATLKALIDEAAGPEKVGECLENQRLNPENGDVLQQTAGGLLVWRKADNRAAFTDGYRTWINGPYGLQSRLNTRRFFWENPVDCARVFPERRILKLRQTDHMWLQGPAHGTAGPIGIFVDTAGNVVSLEDVAQVEDAKEIPCSYSSDYHWIGDSRALDSEIRESGAELGPIEEVTLNELLVLPSWRRWRWDRNLGDPLLSASFLKDGDSIYHVRWEAEWKNPVLIEYRSSTDLLLFGIDSSNFDKIVLAKGEWERKYGFSVDSLKRDTAGSVRSLPLNTYRSCDDVPGTASDVIGLRGPETGIHSALVPSARDYDDDGVVCEGRRR